MQSQHGDNVMDTSLIEVHGVTPEWVATMVCRTRFVSIVFNETNIASVMAALTFAFVHSERALTDDGSIVTLQMDVSTGETMRVWSQEDSLPVVIN